SSRTVSSVLPPFSLKERLDSSMSAWKRGLLARAIDSQSERERSLIATKGLPLRVRITGPFLGISATSGSVRSAFSTGTILTVLPPPLQSRVHCQPQCPPGYPLKV